MWKRRAVHAGARRRGEGRRGAGPPPGACRRRPRCRRRNGAGSRGRPRRRPRGDCRSGQALRAGGRPDARRSCAGTRAPAPGREPPPRGRGCRGASDPDPRAASRRGALRSGASRRPVRARVHPERRQPHRDRAVHAGACRGRGRRRTLGADPVPPVADADAVGRHARRPRRRAPCTRAGGAGR